jgi:peptidoglycan/LPS O-acetylase OafA/YrhL
MEFFLRKVYPWLIEVSFYSLLFPFITFIIFSLKKKNDKLFWLIATFVLALVAFGTVSKITIVIGTKNNIWTQHLFTPLIFSTIAAIYYYSFWRPLFKKGVMIAVIIMFIITAADATIGVGITQMNALAKTVESTLVIGIAIVYFYKIAKDQSITYLDRDPVFLLSCGLLIYRAGSTMSWGLFNDALAESYDAARICIAIIFVLNILFNISLVYVLKTASEK